MKQALATTSEEAPGSQHQRLAFLISGSAEHVLAVAHAIEQDILPFCEIAIIVCNIPGAEGAEATRAAGLQTVTMEGRGREQRDHEDAIDALLRRMRVDVVCLSGYLRVLSASFLRRWRGRVLNVHSSLLPAFPSQHPVAAALEFGARVTGCTVHYVDESVDGGVILEQRAVQVYDEDTESTLGARLAAEECVAYVDALARVLSGSCNVEGRRLVKQPAAAAV